MIKKVKPQLRTNMNPDFSGKYGKKIFQVVTQENTVKSPMRVWLKSSKTISFRPGGNLSGFTSDFAKLVAICSYFDRRKDKVDAGVIFGREPALLYLAIKLHLIRTGQLLVRSPIKYAPAHGIIIASLRDAWWVSKLIDVPEPKNLSEEELSSLEMIVKRFINIPTKVLLSIIGNFPEARKAKGIRVINPQEMFTPLNNMVPAEVINASRELFLL